MGEVNKRHNRKVRRPCPVCGGRVKVASDGGYSHYAYCESPQELIRWIYKEVE